MDKTYTPRPVDTAGIEIPDDLKMLGEALAKNDALKQHPCLVPYEELSEVEKDYDRRTSMETLKFIIAQGYTISK